MDDQKLTYIEETGIVFEQFGMTRMAGRIFGYLIVSDKDAVSFDNIKEVLNASKGSISGTTKLLINAGLVEPVSLPGDRKTYYRPNRMKVGGILKERIQLFTKFADVLTKGRNLKSREDEMTDWLLEISTFYNWIGDEIDKIIEKWEVEKEEIIKQIGDQNGESTI
jgi:DNA-binding transcriptional regulator GbsR (MarR family)